MTGPTGLGQPGHSWAVAKRPEPGAVDGPVAQVLARCAEATLLLDPTGTIVYAAGSVEPLLGMDPGAALGRPFEDLCSGANRDRAARLGTRPKTCPTVPAT